MPPLTASQRDQRRNLITATDVVALVEGDWLRVYESKVDGVDDDLSQSEPVALGHRLEAAIAHAGAERICVEEGWAHVDPQPGALVVRGGSGATIDYWAVPMVVEETGRGRPSVRHDDVSARIIECKLVGPGRARHWRHDAVPPSVRTQMAWQLYVAEQPYSYAVALVMGTKLVVRRVDRDPDLEEQLLEIVDVFRRKHLATRTPPAPDGSERWTRRLDRLYSDGEHAPLREATAAEKQLLADLRAADAEVKRWEREGSRLRQLLRESIGGGAGVRADGLGRAAYVSRAGYTRPASEVKPSRYLRTAWVEEEESDAA